ncbi:hypothetical protein BC826DRAFT_1103689 [Russula brevipes]|nr:hypothetical protein BC826DRAFT_1103689 [Russula brevipes]
MRFCSLREAWESALELKRRPNGPGSEDPIANKRRKTDLNKDGGDPTVTTSVEFTPEDPPSETPTEVAPPTSVSRSGRTRRAPRALMDFLPHSLVGLASHLHPVLPAPQPTGTVPPVRSPSPEPIAVLPEPQPETVITTEPNQFGLYRQYATAPRMDPESHEITDLPVNTNLPISRPASTQETTSEGSDSEANSTIHSLIRKENLNAS